MENNMDERLKEMIEEEKEMERYSYKIFYIVLVIAGSLAIIFGMLSSLEDSTSINPGDTNNSYYRVLQTEEYFIFEGDSYEKFIEFYEILEDSPEYEIIFYDDLEYSKSETSNSKFNIIYRKIDPESIE